MITEFRSFSDIPVGALRSLSNAGTGTAADLVNFQQQLRQERADVMQQVRTELNEAVNDRLDMLNGIATALQRVSA